MDGHDESAPDVAAAAAVQVKEGAAAPAVAFKQLFRYADRFDVFLIVTGTVGAVTNGLSLAVLLILQAKLINSFGTLSNDGAKLYAESCKVPLAINLFRFIIIIYKCRCSAIKVTKFRRDRPTNIPSRS